MVIIETKEDSSEKLAAVAGKPTKNFLFAQEVNQIVEEVNSIGSALNPDRIISLGTETVDGNEYTYDGYTWQIDGEVVNNISNPSIIVIPSATIGYKRKDIAVFKIDGTIERVAGTETNGEVVTTPDVPDGTLYFKSYDIDGDSIDVDPEPPAIDGSIFKKKIENTRWKSTQSGSNVVIPFQAAGQSHFSVVHSGLVSVAGFSMAALTTPLYEGQDVLFENQTGNPITLKDMFGSTPVKFNLGADLIVPNEGKLWFRFRNDELELIIKSWQSTSLDPFNSLKLDSTGKLFIETEFTTALKHTGVCEAMGYSFNTLATSQLRTAPALSAGATFSGLATTNSNYFSMMRKYGVVSDGTAGAMIGLNGGTEYAVFIALGFYYSISFGVADAADVADARMSVGVISSPTVANVNPSTLTDCIMLGNDSGEANLQIMHNDSSGVCTKIDLGVNFPSNTRNTDWYQFEIYCKGNESIVYYRVTRKNTGHVANGIINSNLPSQSQGIGFHFKRGSGTTALPVRLAFGQFIRSYSN